MSATVVPFLGSASFASTSAISTVAAAALAVSTVLEAVSAVLTVPVAVSASSSFTSCFDLSRSHQLLPGFRYGVTISMMQSALPERVRGTAQGLLNMVQIIGNASPLLIGHLLTTGASLRLLATLVAPVSYLLCATLFCLAGKARGKEIEAATKRG